MQKKNTLNALYSSYFLDYFGYSIVYGIFGPLILNPSYGMCPFDMSIQTKNIFLATLFSIYPLLQLVFSPIFGNLSDKFGRKKILIILNIGSITGGLLATISVIYTNLVILFISRVISGIFSSYRSVCMASLSDLSMSEQERSKIYGTISTIGGMSWIFSMICGGVFSELMGMSIPFFITTVLSFLSLIIVLVFYTDIYCPRKSDVKKRKTPVLSFQGNKKLTSLYVFYMLLMVGWGINLLWLNPYVLSVFSPASITLYALLVSTGFLWSVGSYWVNRMLISKYCSKTITAYGLIGLIISFIGCSMSRSIEFFALFGAMASLFGSISWTNALNLISISAPQDCQGKALGFTQSFGSVSLVLAPVIAGGIASKNILFVYPSATLVTLGALCLLGFIYNTKDSYAQLS